MGRTLESPPSFRLPNGMTAYGLNQTDTLTVYRDIFDDDCYRQNGVSIQDGDCILDVGANTGIFLLFLNRIGVRARVFAFEPAPATFQVLRRNAQACPLLEVDLFQVGLAQHSGFGQFTYYPRFSNASTLYPDESPEAVARGQQYILDLIPTLPFPLRNLCALIPRFLQIPIVEIIRRFHLKKEIVRCELWNLSDFLDSRQITRVDLLKIDAEQSEAEIFAGIRTKDWAKIRQVVVEVHGGDIATAETRALLERHGFHTEADPNPMMPSLKLVYATRPESQA